MSYRILVVEDNPQNLELLCDWLDSEGYQAGGATNLSAARAAFAGAPPHAVLLDVQLGGEDGLELAAWLRGQQNLHDIPVIAVTAHAMVAERERILHAGCNACVSKPVDFKVLREELRRWLAATPNPGRLRT